MTYTPPPVTITDPSVHITLKFNLPKRHLDDPSTAIQEARVVAANEAERIIRWMLQEGVSE